MAEVVDSKESTIDPNLSNPDDLDDSEDDGDAIVAPKPPRNSVVAPSAHDAEQNDVETADLNESEDNEDDLFGSVSDDNRGDQKPRQLDDSELDSGDDERRNDRRLFGDDIGAATADEAMEEINEMHIDIPQQRVPESTDGELYLLKLPKFLSIDPYEFDPLTTTRLPDPDDASQKADAPRASSHKLAMNTIRWRRSPGDHSHNESNGRILRWSDGSLTLQLATDPLTQYPIPANPLAPRQHSPLKPTPTSLKSGKGFDDHHVAAPRYSPDDDSFTYIAVACESAQVLRITNKITTGLSVELSRDAATEAVIRLQKNLEAAQRGKGTLNAATVTEDPELAVKKAELAEREKEKANRKRENQEARERERTQRTTGRRGVGVARGLSVGGLEDGETAKDSRHGAGANRRRLRTCNAPRKQKSRRSRNGEIYSDEEEEFGRRLRTKEDEYDKEDDFVAESDEEDVPVESEDDDEHDVQGDLEPDAEGDADDDHVDGSTQARAHFSNKRKDMGGLAEEAEIDAEGDPDDEPVPAIGSSGAARHAKANSPNMRNKRRRIIEDDDED